MLISDFLARFEKYVIYSDLPQENIPVELGIRFFFPVPIKAGNYVFLGTDAEWHRLIKEGNLIPGASYLISAANNHHSLIPSEFKGKVNVVFLDLPIREIIARTDFTMSTESDPFRERPLAAFFKTVSVQPLEREAAEAWKENFLYPIGEYYACIVIRPETPLRKKAEILEISSSLRSFFPKINLFQNRQEWIVIWTQENYGTDDIDLSYDAFSEFLAEHQLNAGVSYVAMLLGNFYTMYLTASTSLSLGMKMGILPRVKRIYAFSQFEPLYLVHLCEKSYASMHNGTPFYYMAHPDIVRIFLYDQEHGTDLLDTLYTYLLNDSSLQKTAALMYMHRNTVYNKLTKIEHILNFHISEIPDNSIFIMSYMIIKYYVAYMNRELT